MRGGGQQQQQGAGMDALYIAAFLVIFCAIMWFKFKAQIVQFILNVRLAEIDLIEIFLDAVSDVASWLHLPQPDVVNLERWVDFIKNANPKEVDGKTLVQISLDIGEYLSIPFFYSTFA